MVKVFTGIIAFFLLSQSIYAQQKEICLSVDDLPVVSYGANSQAHLSKITQQLIKTYKDYQIPAIGFVNEQKLYSQGKLNKNQEDLLRMWQEAGYELGNHTYSHPNYHKTSYAAFTANILKGEKVSKAMAETYQLPYRYFRHPFLRVGQNKSRHDSLTQFLHAHGYEEAPVSIDNDDYLFAKAYHVAWKQKDEALMEKIGKDYVAYMLRKLHYFEQSSQALFDRNIKHILLIHANKLNGEYLDDLAAAIKAEGYSFISMENALSDPAYKTEITRYGDWGISWLDRWALSQGKKGDFFKGDPPTPAYIQELSK